MNLLKIWKYFPSFLRLNQQFDILILKRYKVDFQYCYDFVFGREWFLTSNIGRTVHSRANTKGEGR